MVQRLVLFLVLEGEKDPLGLIHKQAIVRSGGGAERTQFGGYWILRQEW